MEGNMKRKTCDNKDIILIVVAGMSPAVITETIWALATNSNRIIPDRIVAITTSRGKKQISLELFTPLKTCGISIWDALLQSLKKKGMNITGKLRFGNTSDDIRVITRFNRETNRSEEMDDIRTAEDNINAADFILKHILPFTDEKDEKIIASIAGGRKTMGALLYSCMSMVGRETDELTHVLVSEPYDGLLEPKFYFPEQPLQKLRAYDGKFYKASDAKIELAYLPFVPLRNRLMQFDGKPGSFVRLVARYRQFTSDDGHIYTVSLDRESKKIRVDDKEVILRDRAFDLITFLIRINKDGDLPTGQKEIIEPFKQFLGAKGEWVTGTEDIRRELSEIRKRFKSKGITWLPGFRLNSIKLPPFKIVIR